MKNKLITLILFCASLHLCFGQLEQPKRSKEAKEAALQSINGTTLSELNFTDIEGHVYTIDDLKNKVAVFTFWQINNKSCIAEIPKLNQLKIKFKNRPVLFFAIALDNKADLNSFLKTTLFNHTIIPNGSDLANRFEIPDYPYHLILDKNGTIEYITDELRLNAINHLQRRIHRLLR